jgi:IPT/TIG domain
LGGGKSGDYIVDVQRVGFGKSQAASENSNKFSYVVKVTSISPTSGSIAGGTIITVTGENFVLGSN